MSCLTKHNPYKGNAKYSVSLAVLKKKKKPRTNPRYKEEKVIHQRVNKQSSKMIQQIFITNLEVQKLFPLSHEILDKSFTESLIHMHVPF